MIGPTSRTRRPSPPAARVVSISAWTQHEQVCAWVALTNASRLASCMEQLSSRRARRQLHHASLGFANCINRAGQTTTEVSGQSKPVAMALPAGSFLPSS
jgi:hypothetical protein